MSIKLIKCEEEDLEKLRELSYETYYETFKNMCSKGVMEKYLNDAFDQKKLLNELNNQNTVFYFVYKDNIIAGYIKLNEFNAQNNIYGDDSMELERIYVKKEFKGKGLGKYLLKKSTEFAKEKNKTFLWVGVWEKNKEAIEFYGKNGFRKFGERDFYMGDERQNDYLMRIEIK